MGRLMIVDDDPGILESMEHLLEILGHEVEALAHWDAVPARVEAWKPDLLLHDRHMPGLLFEEQVARIRAGAQGATVPLVVFTGDTEVARGPAEIGAQAALPKPFDPEVLEALIKDLLGESR